MRLSRPVRRAAALAVLAGLVGLGGLSVAAALGSYQDGQREIAEKRAQRDGLRDLAEARTAFERLSPRRATAHPLILPADAEAESALSEAVKRAVEGRQVILDGIDTLPREPVAQMAAVHLRATQAGLSDFLRAVEAQTPYLLVRRLEVTPSRSADPEHGKPFVLSADLRLALLVAPAARAPKAAPAVEPASP